MNPLKVKILLLLIKDYQLSELMELIPDYLNVIPSQVPFLIESLINSKHILFNQEEGRFQLTENGKQYLKGYNLLNKNIDEINSYDFQINAEEFESYFPNR